MNRFIRFKLVLASVTLVPLLLSCRGEPVALVTELRREASELRDWRVILVLYDQNRLSGELDDDATELAAAAAEMEAQAGRRPPAHVVLIRDSEPQALRYWSPRTTGWELVTLPGEVDACAPSSLSEALDFAESRFPAHGEVIALAGHGRDWHGFGLREEAPEESLTPRELGQLAAQRSLPETASPALFILAGSYTATAEMLAELAGTAVWVLAVPAAADDAGLDYRRFSRLPVDEAPEPRAVAAALLDGMSSLGAAVLLSPADLVTLGGSVERAATVTGEAITSAIAQEEHQRELLGHATWVELPGPAWVPISRLDSSVEAPIDRVSLYLTDLDELGRPRGHRDDYRVDRGLSEYCPRFSDLGWAPDLVRRRGFLFELWYREF